MCGNQTHFGFGIQKANPFGPNEKGTICILLYFSGTNKGEMDTRYSLFIQNINGGFA